MSRIKADLSTGWNMVRVRVSQPLTLENPPRGPEKGGARSPSAPDDAGGYIFPAALFLDRHSLKAPAVAANVISFEFNGIGRSIHRTVFAFAFVHLLSKQELI